MSAADKSPERLVAIADTCQATLRSHGAVLLVVGEGNMRRSLETEARERHLEDVIRFVGYQSDPHSILALSMYSLLTSDLEGIPMSIIESMQAGTPPIAPGVGGIPEMFDATCGFMAEPGNNITPHLAEAVEQALNLDPAAYVQMQANCRQRFTEQFTHMEQQYRALFETILK